MLKPGGGAVDFGDVVDHPHGADAPGSVECAAAERDSFVGVSLLEGERCEPGDAEQPRAGELIGVAVDGGG